VVNAKVVHKRLVKAVGYFDLPTKSNAEFDAMAGCCGNHCELIDKGAVGFIDWAIA